MTSKLTHVDERNAPKMVDISEKAITYRQAVAQARMLLPMEVLVEFKNGELVTKKGPVFHTAIIAGTQAVKKTPDLIPFCHSLPIERCRIKITLEDNHLIISCDVATTARTGVEMEALTGASVAALAVYDMTKALSHDIIIQEIKLMGKSGGKHNFSRKMQTTQA